MTTTQIYTAELTGAALDYMTAEAVGVPPEMCIPFSTDWAHGGPLIEQYGIEFSAENGGFRAKSWNSDVDGWGEDHLIAVCRAVMHSILGPTVSVPTELVEGGV